MRKPEPKNVKAPEPPLTKEDIRSLIREELRVEVFHPNHSEETEIKLMLGEEEISSGSINL